ncbi:glycoside hydrolase family 36 N-terminal domain-containing protein, partial [[Eubacterium] siraeum]|nr:glycoside hydrolase family 36 N-terminal domain-containing protein [[Eubacterium] siraeum]
DSTLMYSVFPKFDVITRSVKVENNGLDAIDLRLIISMSLDLVRMDYDMITLHGTWARERHVQRFPVRFGKQYIDSNRGATSHAHNYFFALCDHTATE